MPAALPIFLDVDGVLNSNWWGIRDNSCDEINLLFVQNLADLIIKLENKGYSPRIVLSSTWRLDTALRSKLLVIFSGVPLDGKCGSLEKYMYGRVLEDAITPDLKDRTSSDGRVAEIRAWLEKHPHDLYLVLDDLDLLFKESGERNASMSIVNFVHTAENQELEECNRPAVGLTTAKVAAALEKISEQAALALGQN